MPHGQVFVLWGPLALRDFLVGAQMNLVIVSQMVMLGAALSAFIEGTRDREALRQALQVWLAAFSFLLVLLLLQQYTVDAIEREAGLIGERLAVSLACGGITVGWWRAHQGLGRTRRWPLGVVLFFAGFLALGSITELLDGIWRNGRFQIQWGFATGSLHLLGAWAIGRACLLSIRPSQGPSGSHTSQVESTPRPESRDHVGSHGSALETILPATL